MMASKWFFAFVLSFFLSTIAGAAEPECEGALQKFRKVDLAAAVKVLDISKKTNPKFLTDSVLGELSSESPNASVFARFLTLKIIFENADSIEYANLFLAKFDELNGIPAKLLKPEQLDSMEQTFSTALAMWSLDELARDFFALTLIKVANRHPFLVMNDPRIVPILAEKLFTKNQIGELPTGFPSPQTYILIRANVLSLLDYQQKRLMSGKILRLSALTESSRALWNESLQIPYGWGSEIQKQVTEFAAKLGIDFKPPPFRGGGGGTSM